MTRTTLAESPVHLYVLEAQGIVLKTGVDMLGLSVNAAKPGGWLPTPINFPSPLPPLILTTFMLDFLYYITV
jgi:hypothetical protein